MMSKCRTEYQMKYNQINYNYCESLLVFFKDNYMQGVKWTLNIY